MTNTNGLNFQTLKIKAEDNQVGNLTHWRALKNPDAKKAKILEGLSFIEAFIHRGITVQVRKIKQGY